MREPRPDWSPLGVNFKILDEHTYLFYISIPPSPDISFQVLVLQQLMCSPGDKAMVVHVVQLQNSLLTSRARA